MKKERWFLKLVGMGFVFGLILLTMTGLSYSVPPAQLNLGSTTGAPGGTVTIPITLVTNGWSISATSNDLHYDASMLLNPRAAIGPAGSAAGKNAVSNVVTSGLFRIGVFSIQNNNPIGDGVVAYVTLDIDPSVPLETETQIDNTPSASNPEGDLLPVTGSNGLIRVAGLEISPDSFSPILQNIHGFAGVQSQWELSVTGGEAPYTWSIVAGGLPNGLSINPSTGLISGRPLQIGTFPFTVMVVDNTPLEATKDLILSIILLGDSGGDGLVAINELQIVINSYLGIYPQRAGMD